MDVTIASPAVVSFVFYVLATSISLALLRIYHSATNLGQCRTESFLAREVGVYPLSRYFWRKKQYANPLVILIILSLGVTALPPLMWQTVRVSSSVNRETEFMGDLDIDVSINENLQANMLVWQPLDKVCSGMTGCDLLNLLFNEIVRGPARLLGLSPSVPFKEASTGVKPVTLYRSRVFHLETGQTLDEIVRKRGITVVGNVDIVEALPYTFDPIAYLLKNGGNPSAAPKIPPPFQYRQPGGPNISVGQGVFNFEVTQSGVGPKSLIAGMTNQRFKVYPQDVTGLAGADDLTAAYQYIFKKGVLGKSYWFFVNDRPGVFVMVTCKFGAELLFGLFPGPPTRDYLDCSVQVGSIYQLQESVQIKARKSPNITEVAMFEVLSTCNSKYLTPGFETRVADLGVYTALTNLELVFDSSAYCTNIANNMAAIINNKVGLVSHLKTINTYTVNLVYTLVPALLVVAVAIILGAFDWFLVKDRLYRECLWVLLEDTCKSKISDQHIQCV